MAYDDLRDFIARLEKDGQLRRVTALVDPTLEVTEIVQRVVRAQGPALLFQRPTRGRLPLAINLFGTEQRMATALGVEKLDDVGARIAELLKPELPVGLGGLREALGKAAQLRALPPKRTKTAPCQDVVLKGDEVDLGILPGLHAWPEDGGVFLNLGLTHTKHPETGARNLGMYRLQQHDARTVGMHWQIHKDSNAHHAVAERRGERLPEGPFGDHTGFYTPVEPFPALTVDCMTMQRDPVYQTVIVGRPPQEDGPIGKATERIFLPLLRLSIPDIVDYDLPVEGVFHNCVIVSIEKRFPKHAQKVMNAIWGAGLLSLSKLVVVVDADCDVHDYSEVAWRALGNVDYAHDLLRTEGPVDHLDHASYEQFWGGKAGLDATRKLPTEGYRRAGGWPAEAVMAPEVVARVDRRWQELGL